MSKATASSQQVSTGTIDAVGSVYGNGWEEVVYRFHIHTVFEYAGDVLKIVTHRGLFYETLYN